jgi:hypothetical protein
MDGFKNCLKKTLAWLKEQPVTAAAFEIMAACSRSPLNLIRSFATRSGTHQTVR